MGAMRTITTIKAGARTIKVRYNFDLDEYVAQVWEERIHHEQYDYFASCKHEVHQTARIMAGEFRQAYPA